MLNRVNRSAVTAMVGRWRLGPLVVPSRNNSTRPVRTMASTTTTATMNRCCLSNWNPQTTILALSPPPSRQHGRSYATTTAVSFPALTNDKEDVLVSKTTAATNGTSTIFNLFVKIYFVCLFGFLFGFFLFWICLL